MFNSFASSLTTALSADIEANLGYLVTLISAIAALGWGLHFLRRFGILKRA